MSEVIKTQIRKTASVKTKPTKVTIEDVELANEISQVTTIKELLTKFSGETKEIFEALIVLAEKANPVHTYQSITGAQVIVNHRIQVLQADLITSLSQIDEEEAHELSDPESSINIDLVDADQLDAEMAETEATPEDVSTALDIPVNEEN